jgi:hypothetical protein
LRPLGESQTEFGGIIVTAEASTPLSLDVVRARIFYLACDVEPVSPPAAMLLRAVADAIEESGGNVRLPEDETIGNGVSLLAQAARLREFSQRSVDASGRLLGLVSTQPETKR